MIIESKMGFEFCSVLLSPGGSNINAITLPNQRLSVSNAMAHVKFNFLEFLSYRKHYDKSSVRYMMSFEVSLEHFVLLPQITQGKANVLTNHPTL